MEKVRYGIIGLGNQGTSYMYNIFDKNKIEGAVVSACCDNNPAKIEAMKAKTTNKDVVYFADYKEMLDSGLVDAVLVEVPHYQHPEMVMECLKRDIHVISEKPAGVYTKQVKEMNEFAKDKKAFFGMMFNQRTNCLYRKMKEMIADGAIGELQRVNWVITNWFRTQNYYDSGAWRATWRGEGGGVLFNQCPHQIDLVQWVVGEMPISVTAHLSYGRWHDIEVEDDVTAIFKYKNGATGVFVTSTSESPGVNRFEVSGTKGRLVAEEGKLIYYKNKIDTLEQIKTATSGFVAPNFEKIEVETDGKNPQHEGIIQNFTNAILGKEEVFALGVDGYNGVALMDAMQLSGWKNGAEVPLPFDDDEYLEILNEKIKTSRLKEVEDKVANTAGTY
ncbi:MAG: Gfo/Idh/MocA family oxidoreductase [Clostridiales bacterium]|nr:Gfo/Idh/MocA family oxidoreductase [Clostridiales bacterium]